MDRYLRVPLSEQYSPFERFSSVSATGHPATYTGGGALSEASAWAPRIDIPHHPEASTATTTAPSANNRRTIRGRCPSHGLARKTASWGLSWSMSRNRRTRGDESWVNLPSIRSRKSRWIRVPSTRIVRSRTSVLRSSRKLIIAAASLGGCVAIISATDARHFRRILYPLPTTARVRAASGL